MGKKEVYNGICYFWEEEFLDNANWYEKQAVTILNSVDYTFAQLISFSSPRMLGKATLEDLAAEGNCKLVLSHPHMQHHLDEMLYSYKNSATITNRSNIRIIGKPRMEESQTFSNTPRAVKKYKVSKPILLSTKAYKKQQKITDQKKIEEFILPGFVTIPEENFRIFFNVPIVKFWTNIMFYLGFLILQGFVLLNLNEAVIKPEEYILWGWVATMVLGEALEISNQHGEGYFQQFMNQIDVGLIVSSNRKYFKEINDKNKSAAVNLLLFATIMSWFRLLSAFPVSPTFGPLLFALIRLVRDVVIWVVLFSIFAISFQIAFSSLVMQAGVDPHLTYPNVNGSFPISIVAVVGEWSYLADVMSDTPVGVSCLVIYAFIVNVMLINLLIAMMGATYTSVKDNSDLEWKIYRCGFVRDCMATNAFPPPINFIELFLVLVRLCKKRQAIEISRKKEEKKEREKMEKMSKVMKMSLDKIRADDEHNDSQSPLEQIKIVKKESKDIRAVLDYLVATVENINQSIHEINNKLNELSPSSPRTRSYY